VVEQILTWVRDNLLPVIPTWIGWVVAAGGVLTALVAIWKALAPVRSFGSWLVRRQRLTAQLRKLACGMQLDYFVATLKQPAQYVNHLDSGVTEHIFVFPDAYVQVVADEHGTVGLFSITTRNGSFHPRLNYYPIGSQPYVPPIELGRTRFSDLTFGRAEGIHAWFGAHGGGYGEAYYLANPGHYQTFVFASNDIGDAPLRFNHDDERDDPGAMPTRAIATLGWFDAPVRKAGSSTGKPVDDVEDWLALREIREFRAATVINTYAVIHPEMDELMSARDENRGIGAGWKTGVGIGPDQQQVRTFPESRFPRLRRWGVRLRDRWRRQRPQRPRIIARRTNKELTPPKG
jgi:hypothetical protein